MRSEVVPLGRPVIGVDPVFNTGFAVYAHPADYIWIIHGHMPWVAHQKVLDYIEHRIDKMARDAVAKLERMRDDFNHA